MRSLWVAFFSLLIFCQSVAANEARVVQELVKGKLDAVVSVLQQKDLDPRVQKEQIIEIVMSIFDFNLMAKLTLGKKYWPALTVEEQARFTKLFVERLKATYMDQTDFYHDETVVYESPAQKGRKIRVPTHVISGSDKIAILYKLYQSGGQWRIYDVEVEGVSVILTYRSQFDDILKDGTITDLMNRLEEQLKTDSHPATDSTQQHERTPILRDEILRKNHT